jgi:hypothetical protein
VRLFKRLSGSLPLEGGALCGSLGASPCAVLLAWAKNDFVSPLQLGAPAFDRFPNHPREIFAGRVLLS